MMLARFRMAKRGRPRKDEGERGTRQVRVFEDLADRLAELNAVTGEDTAVYLDKLVRPDVEHRCELYAKPIADYRKARAAAEAATRQAQEEVRRIEEQGGGQKPRKKPGP